MSGNIVSDYRSQIDRLEKDPNATASYKEGLERQFAAVAAQADGASGSAHAGQSVASPSTVSSPVASTHSSASDGAGGASAVGGQAVGAPSTGKPAGSNFDQIADFLRSNYKMTDAQIAGVIGNMKQEVGPDLPADINQGGARGVPSSNDADDNQNGYGLVQWGGARKQGLLDFAGGDPTKASQLSTQLGYLKTELDGPYASAVSAVKAATTPQQAADAWDANFEKASDPNMAQRYAYADDALKQLA